MFQPIAVLGESDVCCLVDPTALDPEVRTLGDHLARSRDLLIALSDPMRQDLVQILARAELNVGDIADRVTLSRPTVSHHLNILRRAGLRDFMIQAGGDLYVAGHRGDRPWRLGIRDPRGPVDRSFATLDLSDGTFSTSGDYERFFVKDGRRYHHILDLDVGEPARGCRSVTLVTDRAVIADALAKGVFILGPVSGMALIERLPHVEGVIVSARNEVLVSPGLKDRLVLLAPPTDAP